MTVPLERDGRGVRIAVVDSGVDSSHPWFEDCEIAHRHVEQTGQGYRVLEDRGGDRAR